jgi:uncharacterized protein YecT (DUF1311 family)
MQAELSVARAISPGTHVAPSIEHEPVAAQEGVRPRNATVWSCMNATVIALQVAIVLISSFRAAPGSAADGDSIPFAETQAGMNETAGEEFRRADRELNAVYEQILKDYADDPQFIEKFEAAQTAWISLRDLELKASFPHADEPNYYGSAHPMCVSYRMAELTRERTEYLRRYTRGAEESDACSGSLKTK